MIWGEERGSPQRARETRSGERRAEGSIWENERGLGEREEEDATIEERRE